MSNLNNLKAEDIAQELIPYAYQICSDLLPGGIVIGKEYHTQNLQGGFRRSTPGKNANSLRVNLTKGRWADFAMQNVGGNLLNLIAEAKFNGNIGQAMKYARENYLSSLPADYVPKKAPPAISTNEKTKKIAIWLWNDKAKSINNSLGLQYMETRGFPKNSIKDIPSLRFLPEAKHMETGEIARAVVAKITNQHGDMIGLHRIFLSVTGEKYQDGSPRLGLGDLSGGALLLGDKTSKCAIATEALEDGIAIYLATGATVYAASSAKHLGLINFPDHVETVLVASDNDEEGERAVKNLEERYQDKNIVPALPREGLKDYNEFYELAGPRNLTIHLRNIYARFFKLGKYSK